VRENKKRAILEGSRSSCGCAYIEHRLCFIFLNTEEAFAGFPTYCLAFSVKILSLPSPQAAKAKGLGRPQRRSTVILARIFGSLAPGGRSNLYA